VDGVKAGDVLNSLEGYGTCMWLDLKPDCDRQRLAQQLEGISPFMLLNLRQLRYYLVGSGKPVGYATATSSPPVGLNQTASRCQVLEVPATGCQQFTIA
jgi:hypothetical protein